VTVCAKIESSVAAIVVSLLKAGTPTVTCTKAIFHSYEIKVIYHLKITEKQS